MSFFDSVTKKIGDSARFAAKKSSNLVEITKLNLNINSEEDKINKAYTEIGKLVFTTFANGKEVHEDYRTQCEAIQTTIDNIKSLKKQIMTLKQVKGCPVCGAELELEVAFCSKCGTKQEIITTDNTQSEEPENKEEKAADVGVDEVDKVDKSADVGVDEVDKVDKSADIEEDKIVEADIVSGVKDTSTYCEECQCSCDDDNDDGAVKCD